MNTQALDYAVLDAEIREILQGEKHVVLSTCAQNRVTARLMAHINHGLDVLMSTNPVSVKCEQIRQNPNTAITVGRLKMEAIAELPGDPVDFPEFVRDYTQKHPNYVSQYGMERGGALIVCKPVKISLYTFADGKPCEDTLLPDKKEAYRLFL
jgi:hypothetical protein